MTPYPRDLFGEVPVSWPDIAAWLLAVPRIAPDSPRAAYYTMRWNVPDKIRAAKLRGDFDAITSTDRAATPSQWWRRFTWP